MVTFDDVKKNPAVGVYITRSDETLKVLGFTEHSYAHVTKVPTVAAKILKQSGYSGREIELAKIAGYMHDIGNVVNRIDHSQSGAVMAFRILDNMGADPEDIATIVTAIGNHDESTAYPVNAVAAALILADKTDVRYTRVRNQDYSQFDIHDRVNYAVTGAELEYVKEKNQIVLKVDIDEDICTMYEYFEIFLGRMIMCRRAAEKLGAKFKLVANGHKVL